MKKAKMFGALAITVAMLGLCACTGAGSNAGEGQQEKAGAEQSAAEKEEAKAQDQLASLQKRGQETLDLLLEKVHSADYKKVMGLSASLTESAYYQKIMDADYKEVKHVYKVKFADELYNLLTTTLGKNDAIQWDAMSESLQKSLRDQIQDSYVNMLVSRLSSVEAVAIGASFASNDVFVDGNLANEREMLIYVYEDAYPLVVSFTGGSDGAVSAKGSVLIVDDFQGDSEQEIKDTFLLAFAGMVEVKILGSLNISVQEIQ